MAASSPKKMIPVRRHSRRARAAGAFETSVIATFVSPPGEGHSGYHPPALKVTGTSLEGVLIVESKVYGDDRGFFLETYHLERFREAGIADAFVQDNHSRSQRGVLRGLHSQEPKHQGKLVRCSRGAIFDVAVDIRVGSPKFGQWFALELNDRDGRMLWVPPGFAHGFCALVDETDVTYKCTAYYDPPSEQGIIWNDPEIGIRWPIAEPRLSTKDSVAPRLKDAPVLPSYRG
ncbi:MAG: dTDP-4-dehydrorhamnose 3,5-epimerase [Steroidobacteraceae bacterium]